MIHLVQFYIMWLGGLKEDYEKGMKLFILKCFNPSI